MNRNTVFMYIAVSLVMLVPVPGRLYYGVPVIMVLNLLMVLTTLFSKFMDFFKFYALRHPLLNVLLCSIALFAEGIEIKLCALDISVKPEEKIGARNVCRSVALSCVRPVDNVGSAVLGNNDVRRVEVAVADLRVLGHSQIGRAHV